MSKSNVRDMTSGNITKHLIAFTLPLIMGNVFQQVYNLVDSMIVGRVVGKEALGAVGSIGSLNFLILSLCIGLSNGIGILVSQFFGAGRYDEVKNSIAQSVYVTLASGILMSLIGGFGAKGILILMRVPAEDFAYALTYMRIVCGATVITAIYNTISAVLRALGDSKTPLMFLVVASIINVILDLLFVVKLGFGVGGAAVATVISQAVSAVGSVLYGIKINPYLRLNREHFKVRRDLINREVRIGLPLAVQSSTIAISCVMLQSVVNRFGPTVMAAYTSSNRIEQLVQQPFNSLGVAMSTFAGQNFGAGKKNRVMAAATRGIILVMSFSLIMVLVMYNFGSSIVGMFVTDETVISIGSQGLRFTSLMYVFLGLIYVMRGLLNGVGDVSFAMINGMIEVVGRIGFALLLIYLFKLDYRGAWYTNGLTWSLTGILSVIRFYIGKWKKTDSFVELSKTQE